MRSKASCSRTLPALVALAGVASSAVASCPVNTGDLVPTRKAGVLYINMSTGERTLTRYDAEVVPEINAARSSASLFDYWMSIDENPCWDDPRKTGFGFGADVDHYCSGIYTIISWDYGDLPFDSKITGILVSTIVLQVESVDSNGDGVQDSGLDVVMVYYDALSEDNRSSIAPPTAVVRVDSIPGKNSLLTPDPYGVDFDDYDIIVDFGVGNHFELGDSDGLNRGGMWMPGAAGGLDTSTLITTTTTTTTVTTTTTTTTGGGPNVNVNVNLNKHYTYDVVNPTPDGLADFQYMQYYVKHLSDDPPSSISTFIGLAVPSGELAVLNTYTTQIVTSCPTSMGAITDCTVTITLGTTILVPDPLPAGQGTNESIGFGILNVDGDVTSVSAFPGLPVGCCYWFGGIDCVGFLNNLVEDPPYNETWFDFNPFAQFSAGFFSDAPSGTACDAIDFNSDGFIDSGDISEFITLFLSGAPPADLNNDGFIDNGDIGTFIELFLGCAE